ncbi:PrsW family glutamic-type intramembrane protease [Enterococcus faecalis]|nr:PrsW family glutamic-type intramembrane protease [Enterococcus faecalis]EPI34258.1 hypothetical protein D349_00217 [Enterococcus faecalis UP2S-6]
MGYELSTLSTEISNSNYLKILLGIYIIPSILLLKMLSTTLKIRAYFISIGIFSGLFSSGWISGECNSNLENRLLNFFDSSEIIDKWSAAVTAPFVEEGFKVICVLMIVSLFQITDIKPIFLIGISVGLGFQIVEDISYIIGETNSSQLFFEQVFARISNAISSHWAYTGIFSTGIASILKKIQIFSKKDIYSFVVAPIILHFLWNSPMNEFSFKGINLLPPILSVVTLLFVLKITLKLLKT